jgi:hypothetical protein
MLPDEKFSDGRLCPYCLTATLHRSHRRRLDWVLHVLGFRPVRCSCCSQRFYAPGRATSHF